MNRVSKRWLAVAVLSVGCSKPAEQQPPKPSGEKPAAPTAPTQEPSGTSTFKLPPVAKPGPAASPAGKPSTPPTPASQPAVPQPTASKPETAGKPGDPGKPATPAATPKPTTGAPTPETKPAAKPATTPASKPDSKPAAKPDAKPAAATQTPAATATPATTTKPAPTPKPAAGGQSPLLGAWITVGPGSQRRLEIKENGSGAVMLGDIPWIRFSWVKDGNDIVATHVDNDVKFRITARGDGRLSWRAADGGSAKEVEYERER
jgi:hypothetical protein